MITQIKKSIFILSSIAAFASCTTTKESPAKSSLIVYYSNTGTTEKVAEVLKSKTGADMARIECENPYSTDFMQTVNEFQEEMNNGTTRAIKPLGVEVSNYDTLYIGFPVWFGTYAGPISSFIKNYDLKGKTIIPFCTFGSGGNTAIDRLSEALPESNILPWYGVRTARIEKADKEVESYLAALGIIKGEKTDLPSFSEQQALTDEEKAIFQSACGSYQMPLGSPISVASRKLADATEYLYVCKVENPNGQEASQQIYVSKGDADGSVPEFTQVVR